MPSDSVSVLEGFDARPGWMMLRYIGGRLGRAVPVLVLASIGLFALLRSIPGDPALALAGIDATPETVEAIRESLSLDDPLPIQYISWIGHALAGDFGNSIISRRPVTDLLGFAWPATIQLVVVAMIVAVAIGLGMGVTAGRRPGSGIDRTISGANAVMTGVPPFWMAFLAILAFALWLGWFPTSGYASFLESPAQALRHVTLPALSLGLYQGAILARFVRASIIEVSSEQHVTTARSKGVREGSIFRRHVLRNALIPIVTVVGVQLGHLLGGAVVIESIFAWPGIGRLLVTSIFSRDYPVTQAVLILLVVVFVALNLVIDLLYGVLNPRLRVHR